jgi:hypothetical protein
MAYLPDAGRGFAVMINSENADALGRISRLLRRYLTRDLTPPALPPIASIPLELRQHYAGYYQANCPRTQRLYPVERLITVMKLSFSADGRAATTSDRRGERWLPVSERLLRREENSIATLALVPDADGEILLEYWSRTFKKVAALQVWGQLVASGLILLLMLSSVLFAPVWGWRKLLGKLPHAGPLSVRITPLLSAALLGAYLLALYADVNRIGVSRSLNLSIMVLASAFPISAAFALLVVCRERRSLMNRLAYWHSASVACAMVIVALYLGYWGSLAAP